MIAGGDGRLSRGIPVRRERLSQSDQLHGLHLQKPPPGPSPTICITRKAPAGSGSGIPKSPSPVRPSCGYVGGGGGDGDPARAIRVDTPPPHTQPQPHTHVYLRQTRCCLAFPPLSTPPPPGAGMMSPHTVWCYHDGMHLLFPRRQGRLRPPCSSSHTRERDSYVRGFRLLVHITCPLVSPAPAGGRDLQLAVVASVGTLLRGQTGQNWDNILAHHTASYDPRPSSGVCCVSASGCFLRLFFGN